MKYKLGIIGCGNMGNALLLGVLKKGLYTPEEIAISDPQFKAYYGHTVHIKGHPIHVENNTTLAKESSILILAIKPHLYDCVLNEIRSDLKSETLLVSISPAYSIRRVEKTIGLYKIAHAMPNTPAMIGEGITGICFNSLIKPEERQSILELFAQMGKVKEVLDYQIKGVTAVSGSSPAFVYMLIEAMAQAGIAEGLNQKEAYLFAAQAVKGAAQMVLETDSHPAILRDQVCSPNGTTIEGVKTLHQHGFTNAILKAVEATAQQFEKMQKE